MKFIEHLLFQEQKLVFFYLRVVDAIFPGSLCDK